MDESEETLRLAAIPQAVQELAARLGAGFANYQQVAGRNIPMAGEVGWSILGAYHRVWKGELSDWHLSD